MISIGLALAAPARVYVDVCHDRQPARLADGPELAEKSSIESDDAAVERVRIEIVVKYEVDDARCPVVTVSEQERTALTTAVAATLAQFRPEPTPQRP